MKFYRVAHKESKIGPYNHDCDYSKLCLPLNKEYDFHGGIRTGIRHPAPRYEDKELHDTNWHQHSNKCFGFTSKAALKQWFNAWERRMLSLLDFEVYVFDLPSDIIFRSKFQAVAAMSPRELWLVNCVAIIDLNEI